MFTSSGGKAASVGMCTGTISLRNSNQNLKGVCDQSLSSVQLFLTSWTVACQATLSMGFSRQEYRSGLPCPSPSKGRRASKPSTSRRRDVAGLSSPRAGYLEGTLGRHEAGKRTKCADLGFDSEGTGQRWFPC